MAVAKTLGVSRSNLHDRLNGGTKPRSYAQKLVTLCKRYGALSITHKSEVHRDLQH